MVVNESGQLIQQTDYYPFGMPFTGGHGAEKQQYKYGSKEFDTMHGLNQYDFHARQYDPAIGRFTTVDPKAEKYYSISPYVYCGNNPLKYIDPDGKQFLGLNSPLLGISDVVIPNNTMTLGSMSRLAPVSRTSVSIPQDVIINMSKVAEFSPIIPIAPVIPETATMELNKGDVKAGYKEAQKREKASQKESAETSKNHNDMIEKGAPDGKGTAKRTIQEARKAGDISAMAGAGIIGAGITAVVIEITNPKPNKDAYEAHLENAQERIKEKEKQ